MRNLVADVTFTVPSLQSLVRPLVYGWSHKGEYLYIGKTLSGLRRILNTHDVLPPIERMDSEDVFDIWFSKPEEVDRLEAELIQLHRPKYNGAKLLLRLELVERQVRDARTEILCEKIDEMFKWAEQHSVLK